MDELTSTAGIVAIVAGALALMALLACALLGRRLGHVRAAQRIVLGDQGNLDLVAHASELERRVSSLAENLARTAERLDTRDEKLGHRLDGAVTHCAVIRYDAMGEMTGRQSSSIALLDSHRSGVVLSSILHREQARLYAKQIVGGESEFELSPEEREALEAALAPSEAASRR